MKKAQGLSLNTIVIAAIVVLVLIVLSVIFIRSLSNTNENLGSCTLQGGKCAVACDDIAYGTEDHSVERSDVSCSDPIEVCCIKI
jgi:hypothetical protein